MHSDSRATLLQPAARAMSSLGELVLGASYLQLYSACATLLVAVAGCLVLLASPQLWLGARARKLVAYDDRCRPTGLEALIAVCRVPKSYFAHFYVTGVLCASCALWLALGIYAWPSLAESDWHKKLRQKAYWLTASKHSQWAGVDGASSLLSVGLIVVHCLRRCYESLCVQAFSPYSDMTLAHYALGHVHYCTLALCALADVANGQAAGKHWLHGYDYEWLLTAAGQRRMAGTLLFAYVSMQQHRCLRQLAALRRRPTSGEVYTYAHGIVVGGWFDRVSCPHFLCEVGIYMSLHLILGGAAPTWSCLTAFVCVNQLVAALITHNWYRRHFGHLYPEKRRAIIPYLL